MDRAGDQRASGRRGRRRWLPWAERLCWVLAVLLALPQVAVFAAREALTVPDDGTWSESRRAAYREFASRSGLPAPVGDLRLVDQQARVPVFTGTEELALTLGAGHLPDTAALDGEGNIALAGHRDGFFRVLSKVRPGDRLILKGEAGERVFEIVETLVVSPEDVWVLDPTPRTTLTLITCHPFYFVGNAPDRFIVRAELVDEPASPLAVGAAPTGVSMERNVARQEVL